MGGNKAASKPVMGGAKQEQPSFSEKYGVANSGRTDPVNNASQDSGKPDWLSKKNEPKKASPFEYGSGQPAASSERNNESGVGTIGGGRPR